MLLFVFVCSAAAVLLAEKKASSIAMKIVRAEGKAEEVVIYPTEFTLEKHVTWKKGSDTSNNSDDPPLEFVAAEPETFDVELMFDGFETQENVYTKNVKPLENLAAVDNTLKRPPLVRVSSFVPAFSPFGGVISSISTKYTMFLTDGTPVRATVHLAMKKASSAAVAKSPCP